MLLSDDMAENLGKRPSKGILKTSSSFEKPDAPKRSKQKETKWDEMNIIATLHPPDKDYGHMKIEEPKTPYNWEDGEGSGDERDGFDATLLAEKIRLGAADPPRGFAVDLDREEDEEEEEVYKETEEQKGQRKAFESKRKAHYNEYYAVKLARKLMESEVDEEKEEEEENENDLLDVCVTDNNLSDFCGLPDVPAGSGFCTLQGTLENQAGDKKSDKV